MWCFRPFQTNLQIQTVVLIKKVLQEAMCHLDSFLKIWMDKILEIWMENILRNHGWILLWRHGCRTFWNMEIRKQHDIWENKTSEKFGMSMWSGKNATPENLPTHVLAWNSWSERRRRQNTGEFAKQTLCVMHNIQNDAEYPTWSAHLMCPTLDLLRPP